MSYLVQFVVVRDPAHPGGHHEHGPTLTCEGGGTECAGGVAYYRAYTCNGSYDHYGTIYGSYEAPDGTRHRISNQGESMGGHNAGQTISDYC